MSQKNTEQMIADADLQDNLKLSREAGLTPGTFRINNIGEPLAVEQLSDLTTKEYVDDLTSKDKIAQATKDSAQDALIGSKLDASIYTTDKTTQAAKDSAQDALIAGKQASLTTQQLAALNSSHEPK